MKRLDQLTFTRFFVILLVLYYHGTTGVYLAFTENPIIVALLRAAPTGVGYFYVLSGFVMALVYFRPAEPFKMWEYWRTRFIRIYPLYLISFSLICYYYLDSLLRIKPQKILANVFVVQAWFPAWSQSFNYASWSLTVEFFFYALFPFFVLWAYRRSTKSLIWTAMGFWAFSQLIYQTLWIGYMPEHSGVILYFPLFHLNSFIMGVVGGIWYLREGQTQEIRSSIALGTLAIALLLIAGYTVLSTVYYPSLLPHDLQPMAGLLAPFMILVIVALALDGSRFSGFLSRPTFVNLGETTYAIYILHVPLAWLYERALEHSALANPRGVFDATFLPIIIIVGLIAHFYVDSPLRKWLKKTLQNVSMPLLLLDLAIIAASVYLAFRFRFGEGREFRSYQEMARLVFWCAFIFRTVISVYFRAFDPAMLHASFTQMIRPVLFSTLAGSALLMGIIYGGYAIGWFENFPRSVFLLDWALVFSLSIFIRWLFRISGIYKAR
jgi:peptidoglycan/LPS O-acetylase OafA/YrhL